MSEKPEKFLGLNISLHIETEVLIHEKNKNDRPLEVRLTRGFNTLMDLENGEIIDPRNIIPRRE